MHRLTEHAAFGFRDVKLAGGQTRTFVGYGAVFNNLDSHEDMIAPGAFRNSLAEHRAAKTMPALLAQHGDWTGTGAAMMPVGVWTSMSEDDFGLRVEGRLSRTPRGDEAYALLQDGALTGLSIGYVTRKSVPGSKAGGPRRTLTELELVEVSLVTFPSNPLARVDGVKLAPGQLITPRLFEKVLRDAGFPKAWVAKAAHLAKDAFTHQRDADEQEATIELVEAAKAQTESLSKLIERISQ